MITILKTTLYLVFFLAANLLVAQTQDNYDLNAKNGSGIRFWNGNDRFKMHMGTGTEYKFGPVQDYSIKMNMDGGTNRGFTWGSTGKVPVAGLDINGNFEIAGNFIAKQNISIIPPPSNVNGGFFTNSLSFKSRSGSAYSISYGQYPAVGSGELILSGATFNFKATSKVLFSSNVGIGTSSPGASLEIARGGDILLRATSKDAGDLIFQQSNGSQMGRIWTNEASGGRLHLSSKDNNADLTIDYQGRVGIGTLTPQNKLSVNGHIWAKEVKVMLADGADWVFEEDYDLKSLEEVEKFIKANKHLPEIPSADDFRKNDMKVSEMTNKLLQKIEELTLYTIAQEKQLHEQSAKLEKMDALEARLAKLEGLIVK